MDLASYLGYAGSVARTAALLQAGFTSHGIRTSVAAGEIRRLRHGVVALPGARADFVAAVLANGTLTCASAVLANGTLTCASAAPFHGIWRLREPERLHLLCAHGSAPGAVVHRASLVPPDFPQPVASLTDTLLHALRCLPRVDAAVMVESALRQGRATLDYLGQRLPGNRNGAARAVLDLVDGTADSAIEVVARLLFRSQGIYTQTQVSLPGIGFVDFLLEGFLIVEIDGGTHFERPQVKKDRGRNNASTLAGYAVLRYGYR
jgi:hypothetical protein